MIGQQQLVEIAKAVARNARILIMDEPTSALSAPEVEILFRVIADLKAKGVAIVYISHRLEELIRIGDYITVLRDGRVTGSRGRWRTSIVPLDRAPDDRLRRQGLFDARRPRVRRGSAARWRTSACRASPAATPSIMSRCTVRAGEIRRRLRPDGRRTQRIAGMRYGPPSAGAPAAFSSRQSGARARRRRPHRARPGADPRGSAARRSGADPLGRREPDDGEPAQARARSFTSPRRAEADAVKREVARSLDQGRRPSRAGLLVVGRQSAEGRHRQGAADRAEGAADGRTEPRHRHRRQGATCSASCAASPRKGSESSSSPPISTRRWRSPTASP